LKIKGGSTVPRLPSNKRGQPTTILYVTDSPTVSGAEHVLLCYLDRLRPPDFRTHVFLRATNHRLIEALRERGIEYTATKSFSEKVIRTTIRPDDLCHFARRFHLVKREIIADAMRTNADILHSISYPTALYTALAARKMKIPHIWHEHGVKQIHRFNRAIYRFVAGSCTNVIGPSAAVTEALALAGIPRTHLSTVYNGIDLDRFSPSLERSAHVRREFDITPGQVAIGLVGQLLPHKGHHTLIDAAPEILRHLPNARFFIVGALENPPYEAELRSRIGSADLTSRFTFTGWRADVPDVISAMDVLVVPTLTAEPAALSLMEAMALRRPLIATRVGGTPELVDENESGLLFTPGRSEELAACVIELLTNKERALRLAHEGRRRMERLFSLERHLDEMKRLYAQCVTIH
jgi:glycosyltransferase involved in cell wall biosynthesis